jgi:hypothetical protein
MKRLVFALMLVTTACGGSDTQADGGSTTTTPQAVTSTTTIPAVPTTAGETTTSTTAAATTGPPDDGHPDRAFGSAVATVNGEMFNVEIYACGWIVSTTDPLHPGDPYSGVVYSPEQGQSSNFYVAATAPHGGDFFEIALTRRPATGTLSAIVATSESGDPIDSEVYSNGLLPMARLEVSEGQVDTNAPLRLRSSGAGTVDVEFHGVCDPMGGSQETAGQAAADIAGFTLPVATGTVILDGVAFEVFATELCVALDQGTELRVDATSGETELTVEIAASAQVQALVIQSDTGQVWQRLGGPGEFLTYATGSVATNGSISIEEALGSVSEVELAIGCS